MRQGEQVFVDSGAWIALALSRDPYHTLARAQWDRLRDSGAKLRTSVPVVIETYTFLDRNASRDVAIAWNDSVYATNDLTLLSCDAHDLEKAWEYFKRRDLHRLSAVDATSFTLMKREKIHVAFTFDHHFAAVGFRVVT